MDDLKKKIRAINLPHQAEFVGKEIASMPSQGREFIEDLFFAKLHDLGMNDLVAT